MLRMSKRKIGVLSVSYSIPIVTQCIIQYSLQSETKHARISFKPRGLHYFCDIIFLFVAGASNKFKKIILERLFKNNAELTE